MRQSTTNTNVPRERTLLRVCADEAVDVDVQAKGGVDEKRRFSAEQLSEHAVIAVSQHVHGLFRDQAEMERNEQISEVVSMHVWPLAALRAMPQGHGQIQAAAHTVQVTSLTRAQSQRALVSHVRCAGQFVVLLIDWPWQQGQRLRQHDSTELQVWSVAAGLAPHLCFSKVRGDSDFQDDVDTGNGAAPSESAESASAPPREHDGDEGAPSPAQVLANLAELEAMCLLSPNCLSVHAEPAPAVNGPAAGAPRMRVRIAVGTRNCRVGVWQLDVDLATLTVDEQCMCFWRMHDDAEQEGAADYDDEEDTPVAGVRVDSATVVWACGRRVTCSTLLVRPRITPENYLMYYQQRWAFNAAGRVVMLVGGTYFLAAIVRYSYGRQDHLCPRPDQLLVLCVQRTNSDSKLALELVGPGHSDDESTMSDDDSGSEDESDHSDDSGDKVSDDFDDDVHYHGAYGMDLISPQ